MPRAQISAPPSDSVEYNKTLILVITSEPIGARIYGVSVSGDRKGIEEGEFLGITPLRVPVDYCQWDGAVWFKNHPLSVKGQAGDRNVWSPVRSGTAHSLRFYATAQGHYPSYVRTILAFADKSGTRISLKKGSAPLVDGYRLVPYGLPIKLTEDRRRFSQRMARLIDSADYHTAEGWRLSRIQELEGILKDHDEKWMKNASYARSWPSDDLGLMSSELDHLKRVVGLLDAGLMSFRARMLKKLAEGDIESTLALARTVVEMEKKYLPKPKPAPAIVQEDPGAGRQVGLREAILQQKPYYRATDLVRALSATGEDKVYPGAVQEAYGWASIAGLMGFAETQNK